MLVKPKSFRWGEAVLAAGLVKGSLQVDKDESEEQKRSVVNPAFHLQALTVLVQAPKRNMAVCLTKA